MYKARRTAEPPAPTTAAEFAVHIADTDASFAEHYKTFVTEEEEVASIFMPNQIRNRMAEFKVCFFDASFYCTPRLFYQAFFLLGLTKEHCNPLAHVLMTEKCECLYQKVTDKIKELAPPFAP